MEVQLELMDLQLESDQGLSFLDQLSETHSPNSKAASDITDELGPWPEEIKVSLGDLKSNLLGLGVPVPLSVPLGVPLGLQLPVSMPFKDLNMVGTRKRKSWTDSPNDTPSAKMARDQMLLADCLDNINSDPAEMGSLEHKRDSGSALSRSSWGDITEHLTADLDGLNVDTYNISEAFLTLPNLTVFKQEAPSPSSNENGVSHMSPLSIGTNLVDSDVNGSGSNSNQQQPSPLHALLQPALVSTAQSHSESSNVVAQSNPSLHDTFCHSNQTGQTVPLGDCRFQYVLAAATSIATKVTEETLTYLNQGQSYEIKLKKLGDLSNYRGKILKSVIRICFHDRRLQYMEREQITAWQASRPGERIVEVDVPLSYGAFDINQDANQLNTVEFLWDATKEVGIYIKVNCISTEFTPKKHGGEKGVPFRIQVETFVHGEPTGKRLHAAACQIKVFKLKGADRKHKQDREKITKRPRQEQEKFQPSYECTVLTDITNEAIAPPMSLPSGGSTPCNPSAIPPGIGPASGFPTSEIAVNRATAVPSANTTISKEDAIQPLGENAPVLSGLTNVALHGLASPVATDSIIGSSYCEPLTSSATDQQTSQWLQKRRFGAHLRTFTSFCGADLLRLSREDLIQICGLPDGIRLFNALHAKSLTPRLTIYITLQDQNEGNESNMGVFRALYLDALTISELSGHLAAHVGLARQQVVEVFQQGPGGIHVLVTDEVVRHIKNDSLFGLEVLPDRGGERFCLLLKPKST